MNPKNHLPEGLTPYEATLYAYLTDPTRTLTDPRDFHDRAGVHYAANHGPRTPEHARHILANPHLIRLLTELWNEEPPTPQLLDQLNQTPEGRELLAAGRPTPSDPEDIIVDEAMAAFDAEWWVLSMPELAATASTGHERQSLVDVHPSGTATATRLESDANRAWVRLEFRDLPPGVVGQVLRARIGADETAPTYLFLLHESAPGQYDSELEVPTDTRWVALNVEIYPRPVGGLGAADAAAITRSVAASTMTYKKAWQQLARRERESGSDSALIQAVIDGLTG